MMAKDIFMKMYLLLLTTIVFTSCAPQVVATTIPTSVPTSISVSPATEVPIPSPISENQVWSTGLPPNGKWIVSLTIKDVVAKGVLQSKAADWVGLFSFEFQDGQGIFRHEFPDGFIEGCDFSYEAVENFFRITYIDLGKPNYVCGTEVDDLQWRLDEEGQLNFHTIAIQNAQFVENKAMYEAKPWQKVAD